MTSATPFAAVVLAHADPGHLHRLLHALDDVPVVLHCDAKTPDAVHQEMLRGLPDRVQPIPRIRTSLASWSLVRAELAGVRRALQETDATHIGVLSGADYPLVSMRALAAELAAVDGQSLIWNAPMPFEPWDTRRHRDGGMRRLQRSFVVRHDQLVALGSVPLRWPGRRSLPAGVQPRASTQWKVYARAHAEALLDVVDRRPDLVRFWRTTLVPEETFVASVLGSPELVGEAVLPPMSVDRWFISWERDDAHHPDWLGEDDLGQLADGLWGAPPGGGPAGPGRPGAVRRLFARKFSSRDTQVLDHIDTEFRS